MRWQHDEMPADADGYPYGPASASTPQEPAGPWPADGGTAPGGPEEPPPAPDAAASPDGSGRAASGTPLLDAGAATARRQRALRRRGAWRTVGVAVASAVVGAIAVTAAVPALRARAQGLPSITTVAQADETSGSPAVSVYQKLGPSVVLVTNEQASEETPFGEESGETDWGSGVIFSSDGYIVTNDHVVENASQISVTLADGTTYPATMVGGDPSTDLAVIKINPTQPLQAATFADSSGVQAGQVAIAIGNPLGPQYAQSVDEGIVSAVRPLLYGLDPDQPRVTTMIQTDASINPGNSGGPLANAQGQVIGIVSMKTVSTGEQGVQAAGLGFAIPSDVVEQVANELIQYGYYKWPWLGIGLPSGLENGLPGQAQTLTVESIDSGSPAQGTLQVGDVITTWNGQKVLNYLQLVGDVTAAQPGQTVTLGITRSGQAATVQITLGTEPKAEAEGQAPTTTSTQPSGESPGGGTITIPGFGGTITIPGYGG